MQNEEQGAEVARLKAECMKRIHALINCEQAIMGYFELAEYRKAYIITLECRSEMAELAARLSELDGTFQ